MFSVFMRNVWSCLHKTILKPFLSGVWDSITVAFFRLKCVYGSHVEATNIKNLLSVLCVNFVRNALL